MTSYAQTAETQTTEILSSARIILPEFNEFAIQFGNFGIRWYALAYIAGLLIGFYLLKREANKADSVMTSVALDSLLNYVLIGIIAGGRLGYVLFYNASYFLSHPLDIFKIWQGGMSFHGGLIGVTLAMMLLARRHKIPVLAISDRVSMVLPIGLFLGRIANFINGELWGRITDVPWAMVFPHSDGAPRHPSQLYEAGLEGLVLGLVMIMGYRKGWLAYQGRLTAIMLIGYGASRYVIEFAREPDAHLGILFGVITMGQILCLPMLAGGLYLIMRERRR
ncbi:prolipoprotein diacylglyceryl transferase [Candidatus Puniceispirillum marinum]|uniref:Phosphatidylglycerol--prolipoprotein diacylglyceryl transferase n=1 Tax=Puniceispirillum marinum (strain IMCC1322) TaxID=488538 RepID=D5BP06_PUNMI|nr:prolipoprotein diacylglyceryl transferase [Candidatus Puniceispirillum marinum]ADE40440.1 prolipoprotein diacylglyceryl transferase [Candidatus Puniceispirillum marinum IMCC1322]